MRNLKKILALALALVMTMSVMSIASAKSLDSYADANLVTDDHAVAVDVATQLDILEGVSETEYRPQGNLTRAQLATMIYRITTGDVKGTYVSNFAAGAAAKFSDVSATAWYAGYVGYCADAGYLQGVGDGKYAPNSQLTGYQALAALLRAIGYNQPGEFTGADWTVRVAQIATQTGIAAGVIADLNEAITREQAAQFIYNALFTEQVTYTPAFGYVDNYYVSSKGTLAWDVFDVWSVKSGEAGVTIDNWGRPGTVWFKHNGYGTKTTTAAVAIADDAVNTYTTKVNECTLALDLGIKSADYVDLYDNSYLSSDYYVDALDVVTTVGGQGTIVEVYADRIVVIDTYLAQVQTVVPQLADAAGHVWQQAANGLYVYGWSASYTATTQAVAGTTVNYAIAGNKYAVGDMILVSINKADSDIYIDGGKATALVGTQTRLHYNDGKHTINGADYNDAAHLTLNEAGTSIANHTWYFDSNNNLIGVVDIDTTYSYGVIKNIWWSGDAATGAGVALATIVGMDGSESTVTLSSITIGGVKYSTTYNTLNTNCMVPDVGNTTLSGDEVIEVATNAATNAIYDNTNTGYADVIDGHLMQFEVLANGAVAATKVATSITTAIKTGSSYYSVSGTTLAVNSNTQFLVRTYNGTSYTFVPVTGYTAIGNYQSAEVDFVDKNGDNVADCVYIIGDPVNATTSNLFYLTTTSYTYELIANSTAVDYYVLTGYVDGVLGTVKVAGTNATIVNNMIAAGANSMFVVTMNSYGYVTAIEQTVAGSSIALSTMANANAAYTSMSVVEITGTTGIGVNAGVLSGTGISYYNMAANTPVVGAWAADMSNKVITLVWKQNGASRDVVAAYIVDKAPTATSDPTIDPADTFVLTNVAKNLTATYTDNGTAVGSISVVWQYRALGSETWSVYSNASGYTGNVGTAYSYAASVTLTGNYEFRAVASVGTTVVATSNTVVIYG